MYKNTRARDKPLQAVSDEKGKKVITPTSEPKRGTSRKSLRFEETEPAKKAKYVESATEHEDNTPAKLPVKKHIVDMSDYMSPGGTQYDKTPAKGEEQETTRISRKKKKKSKAATNKKPGAEKKGAEKPAKTSTPVTIPVHKTNENKFRARPEEITQTIELVTSWGAPKPVVDTFRKYNIPPLTLMVYTEEDIKTKYFVTPEYDEYLGHFVSNFLAWKDDQQRLKKRSILARTTDIHEKPKLTEKIVEGIDVEKLLCKWADGKQVVKYYTEMQSLSDGHRKTLVKILVDYVLENYRMPFVDMRLALATRIVSAFPLESKHTYCVKRGNGKWTGVLYNRFRNAKLDSSLPGEQNTQETRNTEEADGETFESSDEENQNRDDDNGKSDFGELSSTDDSDDDNQSETTKNEQAEMLELLLTRKNLKKQDVITYWEKSFDARVDYWKSNFKETHEIIGSIVYFKKDYMPELVLLDYNHMYADFKDNFHKDWEANAGAATEIIQYEEAADLITILKPLVEERKMPIDIRNFLIFKGIDYLLHKNTSKRARAIQDPEIPSFIEFCESAGHLVDKKLAQIEKALKFNETIQPYIIILGNLQKFHKILVQFNGRLSDFTMLLDAVYFLNALYQVFDLKYPKETELLYNFLNGYLFGAKCEGIVNPVVKNYVIKFDNAKHPDVI